jgi:hypothetical protein
VWFQAEVFRKCKLELEVRCFPWRKFLTQIHSEVPLCGFLPGKAAATEILRFGRLCSNSLYKISSHLYFFFFLLSFFRRKERRKKKIYVGKNFTEMFHNL